MTDENRKIDAILRHFMHIPFPSQLPEEEWIEAYRQFEYLFENGWLPVQPKK
ncbi:MAG: hypothetical protein RIE86_09125 [Imperialibacter sp.]|uniref:hypothetical protein n=1 Tax=Imperialibacter sp. TaxID=2038411 RepID=UPI0032EF9C80